MDTSPSGFQSKVFGEGGIAQVTVLKVRALDVGSKSSATRGEAGGLEFPPNCMLCQGGFYDKPFLPVSVWVFSLSPVCRSRSAHFWISFRGSRSACSCRSGVSMEELNSGASHVSVLDQNPALYFLKVQQSLALWKCFINCKGPSRRVSWVRRVDFPAPVCIFPEHVHRSGWHLPAHNCTVQT